MRPVCDHPRPRSTRGRRGLRALRWRPTAMLTAPPSLPATLIRRISTRPWPGVVPGGEQVDLLAAGLRGAPQALAVHGQRAARPYGGGGPRASARPPRRGRRRRSETAAAGPWTRRAVAGRGAPDRGGRRAGEHVGGARRRSTRLPSAGRWPRPGPRTRPGRGRRPAGGAPRADHRVRYLGETFQQARSLAGQHRRCLAELVKSGRYRC